MALPKPNRLRQQQAFNMVYQRGRRFRSSHLILRLCRQSATSQGQGDPNPVPPSTQIGLSISRKVSKRAVVRNRIKRQLVAICRQFLPRLRSGWWIIIVVQPQAVECAYSDFLRELEQLLTDAEVLNGHS